MNLDNVVSLVNDINIIKHTVDLLRGIINRNGVSDQTINSCKEDLVALVYRLNNQQIRLDMVSDNMKLAAALAR